MTLELIRNWLTTFGWQFSEVDTTTLRVYRGAEREFLFFLRLTTNWVLLKIVPAVPKNAAHPVDLLRRLLAVNRDIRLAKYAIEKDGVVSLAAELPTASLKPSQLRDAIERMPRYIDHYSTYLAAPDSR